MEGEIREKVTKECTMVIRKVLETTLKEKNIMKGISIEIFCSLSEMDKIRAAELE